MRLTERKCISGKFLKHKTSTKQTQDSLTQTFISTRYIYKLYDLHLQAENYTEAGFTLKLYADMLCWSKESLTFAPNDTVGQLEWERKENLYKEVGSNHVSNFIDKFLTF